LLKLARIISSWCTRQKSRRGDKYPLAIMQDLFVQWSMGKLVHMVSGDMFFQKAYLARI
jgi:hypothetical protein